MRRALAAQCFWRHRRSSRTAASTSHGFETNNPRRAGGHVARNPRCKSHLVPLYRDARSAPFAANRRAMIPSYYQHLRRDLLGSLEEMLVTSEPEIDLVSCLSLVCSASEALDGSTDHDWIVVYFLCSAHASLARRSRKSDRVNDVLKEIEFVIAEFDPPRSIVATLTPRASR